MILCREQIVFLENLTAQKRRIWNDSADVGVLLNDSNRDEIRYHFDELVRSCKIVKSWQRSKPCIQWSRTVRIPVENDEGVVSGYEIEIFYFKGRGKEFVDFNIARKWWIED